MTVAPGMPPGRPVPARPRVGVWEAAALLATCAVLAAVAAFVSLPVAGAVYVVGFLALTATRPALAFMLMFAASPFLWDVGDGPVKMAVSEISLMLALPVLLFRWLTSRAMPIRNPLWWPIGAYFAVCLASTLANGGFATSLASMLQMAVYLVIAVFVFSACTEGPAEMLPALYGLLVAELVVALLLLGSGSGYVLGLHKNASGTHLSFGVVVAAELWIAAGTPRQKRLMGGVLLVLAAGLAFSLSRGAWVGAAAGIGLILALRGRAKTGLHLLLMLAPLVAVFWVLLPEEKKEYVGDISLDAHNVRARISSLEFAADQFKRNPVLGVGVGLRKMYDATNLVMSTLAETGAVGLTAFLGMFAVFGWMVWRASRAIPLGDPCYSMLTIGAALMASMFLHGCVDHYWGRGVLPVWAAAGMVAYAYSRARILGSARGQIRP